MSSPSCSRWPRWTTHTQTRHSESHEIQRAVKPSIFRHLLTKQNVSPTHFHTTTPHAWIALPPHCSCFAPLPLCRTMVFLGEDGVDWRRKMPRQKPGRTSIESNTFAEVAEIEEDDTTRNINHKRALYEPRRKSKHSIQLRSWRDGLISGKVKAQSNPAYIRYIFSHTPSLRVFPSYARFSRSGSMRGRCRGGR